MSAAVIDFESDIPARQALSVAPTRRSQFPYIHFASLHEARPAGPHKRQAFSAIERLIKMPTPILMSRRWPAPRFQYLPDATTSVLDYSRCAGQM